MADSQVKKKIYKPSTVPCPFSGLSLRALAGPVVSVRRGISVEGYGRLSTTMLYFEVLSPLKVPGSRACLRKSL